MMGALKCIFNCEILSFNVYHAKVIYLSWKIQIEKIYDARALPCTRTSNLFIRFLGNIQTLALRTGVSAPKFYQVWNFVNQEWLLHYKGSKKLKNFRKWLAENSRRNLIFLRLWVNIILQIMEKLHLQMPACFEKD